MIFSSFFRRSVEKERPAKRVLLLPPICKELLTFLPTTSLVSTSKLDYFARAMKLMHNLFKDTESDDNQDNLGGLVSCVEHSGTPPNLWRAYNSFLNKRRVPFLISGSFYQRIIVVVSEISVL